MTTALAVTLARQDRHAEIGPLFEGVAEIDADAASEDQQQVARALVDHANRLKQRRGSEVFVPVERYRSSETMLRKALVAVERVHGAQSGEVATLLNMLGDTLFHHGTAAQRIEIQQRRLGIEEARHGKESIELIGPLLDLASELYFTDRKRSERLRLRHYEITKKHLSEDSRRMAQACFVLESHYRSEHDLEEANRWASLRREFESALGQDRNLTPQEMVRDVIELERQGQDDEALATMQMAVERARLFYDLKHVNLYYVLHHAATLHQRRNELDEAEAYLVEASRYAESIVDEDPDPLHGVLRAMANQYALRKQRDRAIDYMLAAVEMSREMAAPRLAADLDSLGSHYIKAGQYDRAVDVLNESLERHEAWYGPDSRMTMNPLMRLADAHIALENLDEAELYLVRMIELLEATSGPDNPFVKSSQAKLREIRARRR